MCFAAVADVNSVSAVVMKCIYIFEKAVILMIKIPVVSLESDPASQWLSWAALGSKAAQSVRHEACGLKNPGNHHAVNCCGQFCGANFQGNVLWVCSCGAFEFLLAVCFLALVGLPSTKI